MKITSVPIFPLFLCSILTAIYAISCNRISSLSFFIGLFFNRNKVGRCHLFLSDQSTGIAWGCYGTFPGTQLTVGSGEANTSLIVAVCKADTLASFAAKICNDLVSGGQTDWFLPSIDELNLMYKNLHTNNQGNFNTSVYWSSSERDYGLAWRFSLTNVGAGANHYNKSGPAYVRAVRAF